MAASPPQTTYLAFAHVGPGLEALLADELAELGLGGRTISGGVEVRVSLAGLHLLCSRSRLAEGVRVRLKSFDARTFAELEAGFARLPWRAYLPPDARVRVDVVCHKSRLWHSDAVAERLHRVLAARAGISSEASNSDSVDESASRVFVRLQDDIVTVSVDASGERLHRRGYRKHVAEASLRETLAAAMVRAVLPKPEGRVVLWDPFCGAGTIPLEALARAEGLVADRKFAFQSWPAVSTAELMVGAVDETSSRLHEIDVIGSDRDPRAVEASRANLAFLGSERPSRAEFRVGDILSVAPSIPSGAFILTNPPYGRRLEEGQAIARLLRLVRERPDLRPVGALVGGDAKRSLPSDFQVVFQTKNGGLNVAFRVLGAPT